MSKIIGKYCDSIIINSNKEDDVINRLIEHARGCGNIDRESVSEFIETLTVRGYYMCGYGSIKYSIEYK